ncbi:MFS transporter [Roseomonas marmotae]|uniref:MFS transporter n=1 Tax=Roseomonas marmotae TaxID=2768161 RepID=A0ABS3KH27_9PROT|nr:MFS transporter [Roseomonas marmotae]MBO1076292.1 MFS transporter [Roseomonas marmotae]QTI80897.1 MFS transporter [Roseomonas marmotae]
MLAPFQSRSYRFQWPADLATSWAFEMETLVLSWYILIETQSVLLLTLVASLQYLGTLVAPVFGLIGDRIGHRNTLCVMRASYIVLAALLMLLAMTDTLSPVAVFGIAAVAGIVKPSDLQLRNVLISEMMAPSRLLGAISLSRITADTARAAGALAGAGVVAVLGIGWAYLVILGLYAVSCLLSLGIAQRPVEAMAPGTRRATPWQELREAASAVWTMPEQMAALSLAFLINLTGYPFITGLLPYLARDVYHTDQTGLGYLVAGAASGCIAASLLLSRLGARMLPARVMIGASLVWHLMILLLAHSGFVASGMAILVVAGLSQGLCIVPMSVLQLRNAPAALRGRIMGLRSMAIYGLPLGLLISGSMIDVIGFTATATAFGLVGVGGTLLILLHWRDHLWPAHTAANRR